MSPAPSIALRIAWTSARMTSAQAKVLQALASCGDWETGRNCYPKWDTLVARSGLSRSTVARTLPQLEDAAQPGGPWIRATSRRHRHATNYDICVDRLATRPPKEQQVSLSSLPEFECQSETQTPLGSQNDTQDSEFESQNDTPTGTPDLDQERTHTTRAREDAPPEPALQILGAVPPARCAHPHRHAWCAGRVHVPRDLHFEFLDKLGTLPGESPAAKAGRLIAFYAATMRHLSDEATIGDSYAFWKAAYHAWVTHTRERAAVQRPREVSPEELDAARREVELRLGRDWRKSG
jgi:hypothetical protein